MMTKLLKRADAWCFAPDTRYQVGVFRVILLAWFAWFYRQRLFPRLYAVADRPLEFFEPPSLARWFGLPLPVTETWLGRLEPVAYVLVLLALIGLCTRASLIVLAGLNLLFGLSANAWGYSAHSSALPSLVLLVIAFAPGATSFSLDAALGARNARRRGRPLALDAPELIPRRPSSVWPVRAVLVCLCLLYFSAGCSKLKYSGLAWTDGKTLQFYLGGGSLRRSGQVQRFFADPSASDAARFRDGVGLSDYAYVGRPTELGAWASSQPELLKVLSFASLSLELLFPLALLGRWPLGLALVGGLGFHLGIALMLRINFGSYLVCYALFVDWVTLARRARRSGARFTSWLCSKF